MDHSFEGMMVVSFESRRSKEIEKLIVYHGGTPFVAPSMRELPLDELEQSGDVRKFADELFAGRIDVLVLMTGVGTKTLAHAVIKSHGGDGFVRALDGVEIIARGPKPVAALRELGLEPTLVVPEPNTWRDLLETVEDALDVRGKSVYVQEYGVTNTALLEGLARLGAEVTPVMVYRWGLPEDIAPLRGAIELISRGEADIALFTSAQQIRNLWQVAAEQGMEDALRSGFQKTAIGSIGPTTTETLHELGLSPDYEPNSPRMGGLVREMARSGAGLVRKKRIAASQGINTGRWRRVDMVWPSPATDRALYTREHSRFLKACRSEPTDYTPIWIMRQAGRFMREYRELRKRVTFLELCKTPEISAEVTLMAAEKLGVDAAIIFSDILLILESLGLDLEYSKGDGPIIHTPIASPADIDKMVEFDPESLDYVYEAIAMTRGALDPGLALIGFSGAPFTLASYAIEGGSSRNYIETKRMMYSDPGGWDALMGRLTDAIIAYLKAQVAAGADALQLFDSWVGCLAPGDYERFVLPHMSRLFAGLGGDVPVIHFGTDTATLLGMMKEAGGDVIGLDWRVDLRETQKALGPDVAVQGNLDPVALFAPRAEMCRRAAEVVEAGMLHPGHIFNLGHGVLPRTPVDNVLALVDHVHEHSEKLRSQGL